MSAKSGGLGGRRELSMLRSLPAGGIGFVTLKGLTALFADKETTADLRPLGKWIQALETLSAGGTTPVLLLLSLTPRGAEGNAAATLRVSAEISKAGAMDLIDWFR